MNPLVSAIVSTYNSERFIRGCLQDLTEQTLFRQGLLDIIVVNSGSQQNEEAIVREFQGHYPAIQYIRTEERETIYGAWNRGLPAARGKYITNANTDDRHAPEMLEKLAAVLEQNPDVAYVYSHFYITEVPNQTWECRTPCRVADWHPPYSRQELLQHYFCGPQPMWRRSLHDEYGYFDERMKSAGDYEFTLRISQTHKLMRVPEVLGLYFQNPDSLERTAGTGDREDAWIRELYFHAKGYVRRPYIPANLGGRPKEIFTLRKEAPVITMDSLGQHGGLGDRIFQYAFLKIYAHRHGLEVHTPLWIGRALFGHRDPLIQKELPTVYEHSCNLAESTLPCGRRLENVNFQGRFQYHTSYYTPDKRYFRYLFWPVLSVRRILEPAVAQIRRRGKTLVGIHLGRRECQSASGTIAPIKWYQQWLRQIWDTLDEPILYVACEGSQEWLENFAEYNPVTAGDLGVDPAAGSFYPDFYILTQCDRLAISNRSFSFAACMLNERATEFVRPGPAEMRLIPFDPWNSFPVYDETRLSQTAAGQNVEESPGSLSRPQFSLIIRNYNKGSYIRESIESVLAQTTDDWELILVDDASTDDSRNVIEPYLRDPRIRLIQHENNLGASHAAQTGVLAVRAEVFGELDSDDALVPNAIERMICAHREHPECGFIYSQHTLCDEQLRPVKPGFCKPIPDGQTTLEAGGTIGAFRTYKLRDFLKTSMYDTDLTCSMDKDMYYKMEEVAGICFVPDSLYLVRQDPKSLGRGDCQPLETWMCGGRSRIRAHLRRSRLEGRRKNLDPNQIFGRRLRQALKEDFRIQLLVFTVRQNKDLLLRELPIPPEYADTSESRVVLWIAMYSSIRKLLGILKGRGILQAMCAEKGEKTGKADLSRHPSAASVPFVSVYMAAYNSQDTIRQAMASVLAQTFGDFELLVIDDGSTDGTEAIVRSFSDSRIRFLRQRHQGFAAAMNHAIQEARGEFILGVDSDDFIERDYLRTLTDYAERYSGYDYYYPSVLKIVDPFDPSFQDRWVYENFENNQRLVPFLFACGYSPIPNAGSLKRRSMFERTGLYRLVETASDFDFLTRNALSIRFKRADGVAGYHYRVLPASNSKRMQPRHRVTCQCLESMIHQYPDSLLCPGLSVVRNPYERKKKFFDHIISIYEELFLKYRDLDGGIYKSYAEKYRQKSNEISKEYLKQENMLGGFLRSQLSMAQIHIQQGRPEEAAVIYRQIMSNNNRTIPADLLDCLKRILIRLDGHERRHSERQENLLFGTHNP